MHPGAAAHAAHRWPLATVVLAHNLHPPPPRASHVLRAPRRLNNNELTGVPAGLFSRNARLQEVYLNDNEITSLPAPIFNPDGASTHMCRGVPPARRSRPQPRAATTAATALLAADPAAAAPRQK